MADNTAQGYFDEMSDDIFAELLETPSSTAGVADVIGGTKPKVDKKEDPKDAPKDEPKEEPKVKTEAELEAEIKEAEGDEPKEDKDTKVDINTNAALLKAKALGLIERGIWRDIEDIDNFEWTDENYGELATVQAQWKAEDMFNEMLDQSGDYGKTIMNHIKNGGDPAEIINLFKESKRVSNMDISEDAGQQTMIREYYTKVHKWSDAKIARFINAAIDNKALKDEATEIKMLLEDEIKAEVASKAEAQERVLLERQEAEKAWAANITNAIRSRADLTEKEKRDIHQNVLSYNNKLPDGRIVNKFTMDFMKLQSDPNLYIELVRFVNDPVKYEKRIEKTKEKEAAKKSWEFIKGNGAVTKGGGGHSKQEATPASDFKVDWKQSYK